MKTVIIVDDEEDARSLLKQYILAHKELTIVGEATNGIEAVEIINKLKPTTIFLDIQMPGLNGFEVLTHLKEIPEIIFSTAYDTYAIKAFEIHAIDYLLKPYGKKRFETALIRILANQAPIVPLTEHLLAYKQAFPTRIILHKGIRKLMINVRDIVYAEAYGDYTKVYTSTDDFLASKGISELYKLLDSNLFYRLHRSYFVAIENLVEIKKIDRYYYAILKNGVTIKVSESYLPLLKKIWL